jgi:hypothetical protein
MIVRPPARLVALPGLALVFAVALATGGCGLFDTAQPERPDNSSSLPPPSFVIPDSTIVTLQRSLLGRSVSNFEQCFADTNTETAGFHAEFDPADIQDYLLTHTSAPDDWTRPQEVSFFTQFLGTLSGTSVLVLTPDLDHADENGSSHVVRNFHYRVRTGPSVPVAGSVGLHLRTVNQAQEWKITYWEDRRDTTGVPTWGTRRLQGR